jgi:hypothetical protein
MPQPITNRGQSGIGPRVSIAIIVLLLSAASAVHSVDGGPSRFLAGGANSSLATVAVDQQH